MSESINVFVSYSWGVEKDTQIVEELDSLCQQRGIRLIRDNKTLKHGDLIEKFMEELTKGNHVITVFSKPYFESKWCMYELLRIYQRGDFEQRTHPVCR
jgi:TIR domain